MNVNQMKDSLRIIFDSVASIALRNFTVAERMAFEIMFEECWRYLNGDLELDDARMLLTRVELDQLPADFIAEEYVRDGEFFKKLSAIIASARITAYRRLDNENPDTPQVIFDNTMRKFIYDMQNHGYSKLLPVVYGTMQKMGLPIPKSE